MFCLGKCESVTSADQDCSYENNLISEKIPKKFDWQMTLWHHFGKIKDKVVVEIRFGTVMIILYTLVIFSVGFWVGKKSTASDMLFAIDWSERHHACVQVEKQGSYCQQDGNYYHAKKTGNYIFTIDKRFKIAGEEQ